ncbi:uncharacterized protein LOC128211081 [Mya arenaria]|uniref:uncharacterized protein LOC128211081 n=1 Tax=Mya arenaria TaxID=6604 RepID=UPI0022E71814|nr:uncharacterized protein LOC128211081 [Mya arenaria]
MMRFSVFLSVTLFLNIHGIATADINSRAILYTTLDGYCQQTFASNGSYFCRDQYTTGYDYACSSLYCYDATFLRQCTFSIPPPDATICGNGKWCDASQCTRNSNAKNTSDTCPLGDSTKPDVIMGMGCKEIVAKRPSLCLDKRVGLWCCESCAAVTKATPGTFAGPQLSAQKDCKSVHGSNSYFCQTEAHYNGDFSSVCGAMFCHNPASGGCDSVPAADGVACGDGKWCVSGQCVTSSRASANPKADCLFGNQYEIFCSGKILYPNIAQYCAQYEAGCCDACLPHKNASNTGCEYGDHSPVVCQQHVTDGTIHGYCGQNEADCCQTCKQYKKGGSADCPYGDVDAAQCATFMNDTIGPGNCYSQDKRDRCCDTCKQYYNASYSGCEYGDHWKDYCATSVVPPNVASQCSKYSTQCCQTCADYRAQGFPGCTYGDRDPNVCGGIRNDTTGMNNCYNTAVRYQCCLTCHNLKNDATPGCLYGDKNPNKCEQMFNSSRGLGSCYSLQAQIDCCRSCEQAKDATNIGCEYGDREADYCQTNIISNETAFLCFQYETQCCESCAPYKVSDIADCKYGDKNPTNCRFQIPDEPSAQRLCPTLGLDCCETCSRLGHPGPAGAISLAVLG